MTLKVVAVLLAKVREEMVTSAAENGKDNDSVKSQRNHNLIESQMGLLITWHSY